MNLVLKDFTLLSLQENQEILAIRNSEHVRSNMKTQSNIMIENHLNWIETLKKDQSNIYYAVFHNDIIVGAIYITEVDYVSKESTWGLYFKQNINPFISSICTYVIINRIFTTMALDLLKLEVNKINKAAYKFDLTFGFVKYDEKAEDNKEYFLMQMNKEYWLAHKNDSVLNLINKKLSTINLQIKDKV